LAALHVSSDIFAHNQEHTNCITSSGITVPTHPWHHSAATLVNITRYCKIQSSAPDDGRKHRPKHVELTWNNKLIYIVHPVGYFNSCITMHGFMNVMLIRHLASQFLAPKELSEVYAVICEQTLHSSPSLG